MSEFNIPIPPWTKTFFEIKGDKYPERNGWWFSPFACHRDPDTWSHDSDFPMRVDEAWKRATPHDHEKFYLMLATLAGEWQMFPPNADNDPALQAQVVAIHRKYMESRR